MRRVSELRGPDDEKGAICYRPSIFQFAAARTGEGAAQDRLETVGALHYLYTAAGREYANGL